MAANPEIVIRIHAETYEAESRLKVIEDGIKRLTAQFAEGKVSVDAYEKELRELSAGAGSVKEHIRELAEQQKKASTATADSTRTFNALTGVISRYVSAAAIGMAIKRTVDWAGAITDLSAKTGISTTSLQRLESAALMAGGSLEQTATAVAMMSDRLGGGDKSAVAAVAKLGLHLQTLKGQDPGKTFIDLATAIGSLKDPYERATLATDLFGRQGKELLPVMEEIAKGLGNDIPVASAKSVAALDKAGDAFVEFARRGKAALAEFLGQMVSFVQQGNLTMATWGAGASAGNTMGRNWMAGLLGLDPATGKLLPGPNVSRPGLGAGDSFLTPGSGDIGRDLDTLGDGLKDAIKKATKGIKDEAATAEALAAAQWEAASFLHAEFKARQRVVTTAEMLANAQASVALAIPQQFYNRMNIPSSPLPGGGMTTLPGSPTGTSPGAVAGPSRLGSFGNMFMGGLPSVLMGALMGGGNVGASLGGLAGGALGGALTTAGTALGSIVPGIGTVLGGLAGGLFGKLFGPSKGAIEGKQADASIGQLQAQLLATYGSLANIKAMGDLVGVSLAEAWGDKNVAGLRNFTSLMNEFEAKQNRLQSALEKYGLTWEDLGAKAKEFFFMADAQDLLQDFELLSQAGVDTDKLLEKMSASFNLLLQTAIRNGLEIPNAMKPMLERLLEMGLLLDEAGEKILNLDGLFRSIDPPTITIPVEYEVKKPGGEAVDGGGEVDDRGMMRGGLVYRPLGGYIRGTDSVLAALSPGEYVMNRDAVRRLGANTLRAWNHGATPGGAGVIVQVDARDSVFDGVSAQRWADRVADKLMQRIATNVPLQRR